MVITTTTTTVLTLTFIHSCENAQRMWNSASLCHFVGKKLGGKSSGKSNLLLPETQMLAVSTKQKSLQTLRKKQLWFGKWRPINQNWSANICVQCRPTRLNFNLAKVNMWAYFKLQDKLYDSANYYAWLSLQHMSEYCMYDLPRMEVNRGALVVLSWTAPLNFSRRQGLWRSEKST